MLSLSHSCFHVRLSNGNIVTCLTWLLDRLNAPGTTGLFDPTLCGNAI
jgi:hypothetical protein